METPTCPACSAENDDKARFCDQCGAPMAKAAGDEACPACGGRLKAAGGGGSDCAGCGLHVPADEPDETPEVEVKVEAPSAMVPCPLCGEPTRDDAASCGACGLWYEAPRAPQACPRCGRDAGPDDCACGAILTLDRLLGFVENGVKSVCRKCKSPLGLAPGAKPCPACGGELLSAERLKAYARSAAG